MFEGFVLEKYGELTDRNQSFVVQEAFGEAARSIPSTTQAFLGVAMQFYDRLKSAKSSSELFFDLEKAGSVVKQSDRVFVQTTAQRMKPGETDDPNRFQLKTKPKLATLIERLQSKGIAGQKIYMEDLVITRSRLNSKMMRKHPYIIVQIPRMGVEIAICDQVGEITFVKQGTVGEEFWAHMDKDRLKNRDDISFVIFANEDTWWHDLSVALDGRALPGNKINTNTWKDKAPNLDLDLIKDSLLAHRVNTGKWLTGNARALNGRKGSYVLEHGPYAEQLKAGRLDSALSGNGQRGLPGGSSIAKLNAEISEEHGLDYFNHKEQENLDLDDIKASLLAHRIKTGKWLTAHQRAPGGKKGSYILKHGPYAGILSASALTGALRVGVRGLDGGSSIPILNAEISEKHGLDYSNPLDRELLDIELVKESLLAHRQKTGKWLAASTKSADGKEGKYLLQHGPYKGKLTASGLDHVLRKPRSRSSRDSTTIAQLNAEISEQHGLDYTNSHELIGLDTELIKKSLLAYRLKSGEWLSASMKAPGGKKGSYVFDYGPGVDQINIGAIDSALQSGARDLPGGSSIAKLNLEVSEEHELDYAQIYEKPDLDIEVVRASLLAHRLTTGKWLSASLKNPGGKAKSYTFDYGSGIEVMSVGALDSALNGGVRNLPGQSTIAQEIDQIAQSLGLAGETRFMRKQRLGEVIDVLRAELENEPGKVSVENFIKSANYRTYVSRLTSILAVPDTPQLRF